MIKLAINGFGRIGRNILRALYETGLASAMKVVAINEIADANGIAHLLKYDTTHGRFGFSVTHQDSKLIVAGDEITLTHEDSISNLPWGKLDVDLVLECTGVYTTREHAQMHLDAGAKQKEANE